MALILSIDPGPEDSAWLKYDTEDQQVIAFGIWKNEKILYLFGQCRISTILAIEMVACYGMPVGKSTFETCVWIGRFIQAWDGDYNYVYRKEVRIHLCNSMRAKDSNVRQVLIDRFPSTGSGTVPQIGTKTQPGPLYGVKKDIWSALAIAVTQADKIALIAKEHAKE